VTVFSKMLVFFTVYDTYALFKNAGERRISSLMGEKTATAIGFLEGQSAITLD